MQKGNENDPPCKMVVVCMEGLPEEPSNMNGLKCLFCSVEGGDMNGNDFLGAYNVWR